MFTNTAVFKQLRKNALLVTMGISSTACEMPPVQTFEIRPTQPAAPGQGNRSAVGGTPNAHQNEENGGSSGGDRAGHFWILVSSSSDTLFKAREDDSSLLSRDEKCVLHRGTRHSLATAPEWQGSHLKITLKQPMVGCAFTVGWVFAQHIQSTSADESQAGGKKHRTVATLYTTENTPIEGGPKDRCGRKLNTLDDYMNWRTNEVSVAMDRKALPYGTLIRIPEIEKRLKVKDPIPFKVVDTGSAFIGKGMSRIDICVGHNQDTIYSSQYVWMSHGSFEFEVIQLGASFDCY